MKSIAFLLWMPIWVVCIDPLIAQSLISKLPAEGTWATYDAVFESIRADGASRKNETTVTVRALGSEQGQAGKLRWVEIDYKIENEKSDLLKFLVAEADIGLKSSPLRRIQKLWQSRPEFKETLEIDTSGNTPLEVYLAPDIEVRKGLEKKNFMGDLKCDGITGKFERYEERGTSKMNIETTYTEYWSEQSPFGSVYFSSEQVVSLDGAPFGTRKRSLTLKESGDNAKSALPDKQ